MTFKTMIQDIAHIRTFPEAVFNAFTTATAFLLGYFNVIILDNVNLFMAVFIVCSGDWIFGVLRSLQDKQFETRKAMKIVWYLTGYWTILFIVLSIEKAHQAAFFLSEAIILPIIVFQLISLLKNASLLGVIPQGLLLTILQNIDSYKHKAVKQTQQDEEELEINS